MILYTSDSYNFYTGIIDIPARFPGQGLPSDTCEDAPPTTVLPVWQGWQRVRGAWVAAPDNRGRQGFVGGQPHTCANPELPEGFATEAPKPEPRTFEEVKSKKYSEILAGSNAMDAAITARYSVPERTSFENQRRGAEAVMANNPVQGIQDSSVTLVSKLAAAEGVSVVEFAQRVLHNVAVANAAMEAVLLQQRAYEAALKKATNVEEVDGIVVNYIVG